jgi:hypothetical protein
MWMGQTFIYKENIEILKAKADSLEQQVDDLSRANNALRDQLVFNHHKPSVPNVRPSRGATFGSAYTFSMYFFSFFIFFPCIYTCGEGEKYFTTFCKRVRTTHLDQLHHFTSFRKYRVHVLVMFFLFSCRCGFSHH